MKTIIYTIGFLMAANVSVGSILDMDKPIQPTPGPALKIKNAVENSPEEVIPWSVGKQMQSALCVEPTGDFGPSGSGSPTRQALKEYNLSLYSANPPADAMAVPDFIASGKTRSLLRDLIYDFASCEEMGFADAYEVGIFHNVGFARMRKNLADALKAKDRPVSPELLKKAEFPDGKDRVNAPIRDAIRVLRGDLGFSNGDTLDAQLFRKIIELIAL